MSDTTTTSSVAGLNDRVNSIMARAGVTTVPDAAGLLDIEVKELYKALKAERDNTEYDGPAVAAVEAYEAANPAPEGEEEAAAEEKPKAKKTAREPKAKKEKAPKAPREEKPVVLPTEVGKAIPTTGGRVQVKAQDGSDLGMRSIYGARLQEDGTYTGHIVSASRELLVKAGKGGDDWQVTGPKPTAVERKEKAAAKPKAAKAAKAEPAAEASAQVRSVPKPGGKKSGKK